MIHHQSCFTNSKILTRLPAILLLAVCSLTADNVKADLINGDFEQPDFGGGVHFPDQSLVPGWSTTASDGKIEIWSNHTVPSASGFQHAELNAFFVSTLFQEVAGIAGGQVVDFSFAHRGRNGIDTMRLSITDLGSDSVFGNADDTELFSDVFSAGNTAWVLHTSAGLPDIITLGNSMRFSYESVSTVGNDPTEGNFIDDAKFGLNVLGIPEPSSAAILGLAALGMCIRRRRR